MNNNQNSIKQLAMKAKKRLKMQDSNFKESYSDKFKQIRQKRSCYAAEYCLKKISDDKVGIKCKIDQLLQTKPLPPNPLEKIIDYDYFSTLSDVQRSRYIINLSRLYRQEVEFFEQNFG